VRLLILLALVPAFILGAAPTQNATLSDGAAWLSGGPAAGLVHSVSVAPADPSVVYAGTVSGVYASTDHGQSWSAAGLREVDIRTVQIDPGDPDTVYAVADVSVPNGIFRSTNGGQDWSQMALTGAQTLDIDPSDPQVLWAGTETGRVFRSADRGTTWTLVLHKQYELWSAGEIVYYDHPVTSVLVDPEDPDRVYLALDRGDDNAFGRTDDGGQTWEFSQVGQLSPDSARDLAVTPAGYTPQALFVVSSGDSTVNYTDAIYRSVDKGGTWQLISGYVGSTILVHPSQPHRLFLGTTSAVNPLVILDHTDGSWVGASSGLPGSAPDTIAVSPDGSGIAYVGYATGRLHRSVDGGLTWGLPANGIANSDVTDIAISPTDPSTALAAIMGQFRVQRTLNGGGTWSDLASSPDHAGVVVIDPSNAARMIVGTNYLAGYLYRSQNGGSAWTRIDADSTGGPFRDIWIHPDRSNIVLTLRDERTSGGIIHLGGVRRSTDGGDSWSQVRNWWRPTVLASDPNNHDVVYLGLANLGYVERSTDAGLTWTNISPPPEWAGAVLDLVVDTGSNVYAATSDNGDNALGGIWRRSGTDWSRLVRFEGTTVTALTIDHSTRPNVLYAGTTDRGVLVSDDGGTTWAELNTGLGARHVTTLELSVTRPTTLYAGTRYGGVWSIPVDRPQPAALACPPGQVPVAPFTDVSRTGTHTPAIDCAVWYGIARGTTSTTYAPTNTVNRAQMASFIARLIEAGGSTLPPATPQGFTDLGAAGVHATRINQLAAAGIVRGTSPTTYSPLNQVTRAQMATFLVNAYEYVSRTQLPAGTTSFTDIAGNTHETNIRKAATADFARGTTPTTYAPANPVRRDQMASFLTRVLERYAADGNTLRHLD
jgi:hypothetical protein